MLDPAVDYFRSIERCEWVGLPDAALCKAEIVVLTDVPRILVELKVQA